MDDTAETHAVTVVGAGAMGHGLAVQCALEGQDVTLTDHRRSNLEAARDRMAAAVAFLAEAGRADGGVPDVGFTTDLDAAVSDADVVLESVSEDLAVKREVFATVAAAAPPEAVLASNTSSLSIDAIADAVPDAADRVAGCHWWFPPYLLRPVEVVRGARTTDATVDRLCAFVEAVDRDPVLVQRDVPGFVWNRVQFAVVRECLHLVEAGVASVADVNRAVRDGYATRTAVVGPFETMDLAGLDLFETIAAELYPHLSTATEPQAPLTDRVREGATGVDAGEGFFGYGPDADVTRRRDEGVAAIQRALGGTRVDRTEAE